MPESNLLVVKVLRTDDLLALQFEFVNLHLDTSDVREGRLVHTQAGQPAFIIVHFPPQHIAEQAFPLDATGGPPPGPVPVQALLSGPRVVASVGYGGFILGPAIVGGIAEFSSLRVSFLTIVLAGRLEARVYSDVRQARL
jgi:hypothetical protein